MRIISGSCRGRKLVPVQGHHIRPTSDRTREAVFNIIGPRIKGANVLDLFTGTGAMGIEALSRGAGHTTFIDTNCEMVQSNLTLCRLEDHARVLRLDLVRQGLSNIVFDHAFDIVFIDPPYNKGYIEKILLLPGFIDLLAKDAWIIAEYSYKEKIKIDIPGLDILKQKKYSKTKISILTRI